MITRCLLFAVAAQVSQAQVPGTRLDSALAAVVSEGEPGVAMLIIKDGQVAYRGARGLANLSRRESLTTTTPIYIASIAKQFTAAGIMRLAERGELRYDDAVVKYVPELSPFADSMTIRQVLTHTSGLPDHLSVMKDSVPGWTNADVLAFLRRRARLEFDPGTRVLYSNSGYVVLATIIERLSGKTYSRFLGDEFFTPLHMNGSGVITREGAIPTTMAAGYVREGTTWTAPKWDVFTYGAGGVVSTIEDLARWDQAMSTGKVLADSSLQMAATPARLSSGRPTAWGFGWLAEFEADGPLANVWYVASIGSFKGYHGILKRIDDRKFTIILLTNRGALPWPVVQLGHELFTR